MKMNVIDVILLLFEIEIVKSLPKIPDKCQPDCGMKISKKNSLKISSHFNMPYEEDQDYMEGSRRSLRERKTKSHTERKLRGKADELKFLEHFDPGKSNREKRKLRRKPGTTTSKNSLYDEYGRIKHNKLDICDCMDDDCDGCWFECENCMGIKCGLQCRVNRKFFYDCITFDGKDATIKNKHF